ncbi:Gfo/Idh/MocA family oxidoreductase [Kitasatospora nipponensis]|uniref:Gfo/Idh/MocA family oxidoreductase n=1 Tax=Kitasatospora nipponensis TaxID=258049 RepID=A0ABN1W4I8_9ACTN
MRVGLLGTGPWAQRVHAPALAAHPGVEFAGVWGRRAQAAQELAAAHGVPAHRDLDQLLGAVDAVSVALPPDVQPALAVRAAGAGCHLLLDKPVAMDVEAAQAVVAAVERARVASRVFFTLRFDEGQARWVREQAAAGGWFTADARWLSAVFSSGDSPYAASPWRRERGPLWDVGPHALSVLLPVLGPVERITAARGAGDTVHLVLRHAGGASSTAHLSMTAPPKAAEMAVELRGEQGVTAIPSPTAGPGAAFHRALDELLAAAAAAAAGGADPVADPCDAAFGLRVVRLDAAAEHALEPGCGVPVADHPVG